MAYNRKSLNLCIMGLTLAKNCSAMVQGALRITPIMLNRLAYGIRTGPDRPHWSSLGVDDILGLCYGPGGQDQTRVKHRPT
jgi:hypothetical protein